MNAGIKPFGLALAVIFLISYDLLAQGKGVFIEENHISKNDASLIAKAKALKDAGRLVLNLERTAAALAKPSPEAVALPRVSRKRLEPEVIAATARKALIRVGWLCLCTRCDRWHINLAGGYPISKDGVVATCHHVVSFDKKSMREGYLVAADTDGQVFPVTGILAADEDMDVAIIRIDARQLTALPINDQGVPGAAAYLFSDPLGVAGYFSAGMVNRYYWKNGTKHADTDNLKAVRHLRMNVSTDWAPGSSGAAVLDGCGNAIGHVSEIRPLGFDGDAGKTARLLKPTATSAKKEAASTEPEPDQETILVLHEAIPARGVKLLLNTMQH